MVGQTVSHYRILEKIGEGGMGVVYKAEDTKLGRIVALKFLPPGLTRDEKARERFIREAQAASTIDHPNVCTIHEVDATPQGRIFICMAYYEGASLRDRIQDGPFEIVDAIDVTMRVAEGVAKAHEKGIIHRDIKTANILITTDDEVKLVDFGLAKLTGRASMTRTGTTVGTMAYMSPEQARGEDVDHRTDIWSLGVVLYEMLTGGLPFGGEYDYAVAYSIMNEAPKPIASFRADIPRDLEKIVERSLAKKLDERYQSVRELLADLANVRTRVVGGISAGATGGTEALPSIAVLPFENMSPDPGNAFFADGLAEELINALTHLKGLRVAARTSAFRFRGKDVDIREIGRKLDVRTVLAGSVRRSDSRLRVTAQLIDAENGYHLWSDRYDREMEDIFAIQDEITASIVKQLRVKLVDGTDEALVRRPTENLEAYSLFLEGQYHLFSLTPEGWEKSFELFKEAIKLDPGFARAYAWQAQNYQSLCFWGDARPREAMEHSRRAVERALELDDALELSHAVNAVIRWAYDWDWDDAEREFKRAIELEPTEPFNHVNYSLFLAAQGRFDEALVESRLGRKLDPLSSLLAAWGAIAPAAAGMIDESIEVVERAVRLGPDQWQPYFHLCATYLHASRMEDATRAGKKAMELSGGASVASKQMAVVYYLTGNPARGDELFRDLVERSEGMYVAPTFLAEILLARGETDKALKYLERAVQERDSWLVVMPLNPPQIRPSGPQVEALLSPVWRKRPADRT